MPTWTKGPLFSVFLSYVLKSVSLTSTTFKVRSGRFGSWNLLPRLYIPWIRGPPQPRMQSWHHGLGEWTQYTPQKFHTTPEKFPIPKGKYSLLTRRDVKLRGCTYPKTPEGLEDGSDSSTNFPAFLRSIAQGLQSFAFVACHHLWCPTIPKNGMGFSSIGIGAKVFCWWQELDTTNFWCIPLVLWKWRSRCRCLVHQKKLTFDAPHVKVDTL